MNPFRDDDAITEKSVSLNSEEAANAERMAMLKKMTLV